MHMGAHGVCTNARFQHKNVQLFDAVCSVVGWMCAFESSVRVDLH